MQSCLYTFTLMLRLSLWLRCTWACGSCGSWFPRTPMCVLTHAPVPTGTSSQHMAASKHNRCVMIRRRLLSGGAWKYCSRMREMGEMPRIFLSFPPSCHRASVSANCRRAQLPSLCGRRSPTTHLLDLNHYGHSRPAQFYPLCSIPHREQPLSLVKKVDKFDLLPEESSPVWWWLIIPGVAHCPSGIHHCRLSGDERIFFF